MRVIRICRFGYKRSAALRQFIPPRSPSRLPGRGAGSARMLAGAALALLLVAAAPAQVVVVSAGLFGTAAPLGDLPGSGLRQETLSGVDRVALPPLLRQTDEIPAEPCRRFGLIYAEIDAGGASAPPLTIRITHPALKRPDGATGSIDMFEAPPGPGLHFIGFTFDEEWERVPGVWTFAILAGDQVLASQSFTVRPATGASAGGCQSIVS